MSRYDAGDPCVYDEHPVEHAGTPETWRCSLYGCMWWLWSAVDGVRGLGGWQHVMVRRYEAPVAVPEGRLF